MSGLAFMLEPQIKLKTLMNDLEPSYYISFSNGLSYNSNNKLKSGTISPLDPAEAISPNCYEPLSRFEITDPAPFGGYDPRCRPWY